MIRLASSVVLLVLTVGQGLSWICVGSAGALEASPAPLELVAEGTPAPHHDSGLRHDSDGDPGHGAHSAQDGAASHRDAGHDSHHDSEDNGCDAMMACGMAGAAVSSIPALHALVAGRLAALESGLLLHHGPLAQDPPPPRLG